MIQLDEPCLKKYYVTNGEKLSKKSWTKNDPIRWDLFEEKYCATICQKLARNLEKIIQLDEPCLKNTMLPIVRN